jgi:hypothetical protein
MKRKCKSLAGILAIALVGCGRNDNAPVPNTGSIARFPNPGPGKSDIKILSATTFLFHGQRCQLLGVAESDDAAIQGRALDFTRRWFDSIGNYIAVYNANNPLRLQDGTCVVWVRGSDCWNSCLNLELVRAGLVKVDYQKWSNYSFTETEKDRDYVADWRGDLDSARRAHDVGEKPQVLFQWPPEQKSEPTIASGPVDFSADLDLPFNQSAFDRFPGSTSNRLERPSEARHGTNSNREPTREGR